MELQLQNLGAAIPINQEMTITNGVLFLFLMSKWFY